MKIKQVNSLYTQDQLQKYLARIGWSAEPPQPNFECLKRLMQLHLCTIPFSNTFIVYEKEPPGVEPQEMFERLVRQQGSSFCFGQNLLFRELLRAIGFKCYSTAARVNGKHANSDDMEFGGLSHMCTFVSFQDDRNTADEDHLWLVDVGFGGLNINEPLPLHDTAQARGALNITHRIHVVEHPNSSLDSAITSSDTTSLPLGKELALQYQARDANGEAEHPWRTCYAFFLAEMHPEDFSNFHFSICRRPGLFTQNVVASRLLEPCEAGQPMGRVTIFNDNMQKRYVGRETEKTTFASERQRIHAIRSEFGIGNLPEGAEENIRRKGLAIAGKP